MFTITLTDEQIAHCSHPGDCDEDVSAWIASGELDAQLSRIAPEDARNMLAEYGAWDDTEIADHVANLRRILWIAAGDCKQENTNTFYYN